MAPDPETRQANGATHTEISRQISAESQLSTGSVHSPTCCQKVTSWRYKITLLIQMAIAIILLLSFNMPIALVCMIQAPASENTPQRTDMTSVSSNVSFDFGTETTPREANFSTVFQREGEFHWESSIQGLVLASQGFLSFVTPSFSDWFGRHLGGKLVLQVCLLANGGLTLLMPVGARLSPYILIVLRCLLGAFGGIIMPLTSEVFAWWAPEPEKVSMVSIAYMGVNTGNMLASLTSGYLCSVPYDNGWPFIFYVHGALTLAWCLAWQLFGAIRPEDHPFVSKREKVYIIKTRLGMEIGKEKTSPPYKAIAMSRPVWGFMLSMTAQTFASMLMYSYLPLYLSTQRGMDIEEIGLFSSLNHATRLISMILWGRLSSLLSARFGITATRKIIQCSGLFASAGLLIVLAFVTDTVTTLVLLVLIMMMLSCSMVSGHIVPLDMAPRYANFINGCFLTAGGLLGVAGPIVASLITSEGTQEQWRNLFILVACVVAAAAFIFVALVSSELQPWAIQKNSTAAQEKTQPVTPDLMTFMSTGPLLTPTPSPSLRKFVFTLNAGANPGFNNATSAEEEDATAEQLPANVHRSTTTANAILNTENDATVRGYHHSDKSSNAYSNPALDSTEDGYGASPWVENKPQDSKSATEDATNQNGQAAAGTVNSASSCVGSRVENQTQDTQF